MAEVMVDVLEKKFDPKGWQTCQKGKVFKIEDLSRNDLLQLVCEGMQAVAMLESFVNKASDVVDDWHNGKIGPDPEPVQEVVEQCRAAANELSLMDNATPTIKQAQRDLLAVANKLAC